MKRAKRLTKRERKALAPKQPPAGQDGKHIHCIACGKHLDPSEFQAEGGQAPAGGGRAPAGGGQRATATVLRCQHKSTFAACVACADLARRLLAEHDRTGQPVQTAAAWH